jgi:glyoxylase-like metal-dependent hydrolase (beta-lactamase superfamily II)
MMLARAAVSLCMFSATLSAQSANLSISWVGQSCFVLRGDGGPTVVTDPPATSLGYTLPALNADAVTITHNHSDHNYSAGVGGKFTLVDGRPTTPRQVVEAAGLQCFWADANWPSVTADWRRVSPGSGNWM